MFNRNAGPSVLETSVGTTRGHAGGPVSTSGNSAKDDAKRWILSEAKARLLACLFACLSVMLEANTRAMF